MCSTCRAEVWLEEHIDAIEEYLILGCDVKDAIAQVKKDNKRYCRNCGDIIDKGNFCTTRVECRRAYTRFRRKYSKGISKETAIREAVCKV